MRGAPGQAAQIVKVAPETVDLAPGITEGV
jgi:hypothetical protein